MVRLFKKYEVLWIHTFVKPLFIIQPKLLTIYVKYSINFKTFIKIIEIRIYSRILILIIIKYNFYNIIHNFQLTLSTTK